MYTNHNLNRHIRYWANIILLLTLLLSPGSQALASPTGELTTEDGLSSNSVKTIYRDKIGYVYFGTSIGVDRYDGTNIINIPFPIESKSEKCWVSGIVDAGDDKLYVSNNVGLFLLDKRSLAMTRVFADIIDCEVTSLLRTPDDKVYVSTVNGLYRISVGNFEDRRAEPIKLGAIKKFSERNIRDIALLYHSKNAGSGKQKYTLCCITGRNLLLLPQGEVRGAVSYPCPATYSDTRFLKVAASKNLVFIGTNGKGVLPFDISSHAFKSAILNENSITDMQASSDSLYVSTTENGTFLLDTNLSGEYTILRQFAPHEINSNSSSPITATRHYGPFAFLHDNMGIDWTGYLFFGIDYTPYSYQIFNKFHLPGISADDGQNVQNVLIDGNRIILSTRNGLYICDMAANTTRQIGQHMFGTKMISDVKIVPHGYLVSTIGNGFFLLDKNSFAVKPIAGGNQLERAYVYLSAEDGNGNLWFATTKGAACYDLKKNSVKIYNSRNSQLPDDEVFCLNFDINGRGWLSTRGGLCCYDPVTASITTSNMPKILVGLGELRNISRWSDGSMCFLPQHGFPIISDASASSFKRLSFDIYEENVAINFFIRHKGMYVFSTEKGLYSVAEGKCRFFGYVTNIDRSNMSAKSPFIDEKGQIWISTNEGVFYTDLKSLSRTDYAHLPIVLSEIQTDHWFTDSEVSMSVHDNLIQLSRYSSDLRLKFSPLIFGDTRDFRFRYMMEGIDDDWRICGNSRTIFYHSLPFGCHHLKIEVLGMPEISADIVVDVPLTYSAISTIILITLLLLLISHIIYCKVRKKEYLWQRFLPKPEKYQTSRLDRREGERLTKALIKLMNEKKPYLDANIQMSDFAKMLGCSTHTLSQIFTLFIKRNYYDFIAEYRIEEFKRLSRNPQYSKYTITALSNLCGFRSRTPFLAAFKKFAGMTPKEWMKNSASS